MVIKNETRNTILSKNAIIAKSFKQKAFGLLLEKKGTAMIFQTRFGIHTFFMKYSINILVLDKENKVAAMKQSLRPNKVFLWNPKHKTILELPEGVFTKTQTDIGDLITA